MIGYTDITNTQFNAAQVTARAAHNSCSVPHGADLARAQAALQTQLQQASHTATTNTAAGKQMATTRQAAGTTADSLPPDSSKHT